MRTRTKENVKYRYVNVNLTSGKEIPLAEVLVDLSRKDAMLLFQEMEEKGLGTFIRGTQGKGKTSKFIPAENCPNQYTFQVVFFRDTKKTKESVEPVVEQVKKHVDLKLLSINNEGGDYALSQYDGKVHIERVNGLGFKTIEGSVEHVWDILKDKVYNNCAEPVSDVEQVCSILRGSGYVNLNQ